MMDQIIQDPQRCRARVLPLLVWMFKAAAASVVIGSLLLGIVFTFTSVKEPADLLFAPLTFASVGFFALIGVFLTVALIAFPIRLFFWKRSMSVTAMTVGSAITGGLIYTVPLQFRVYESLITNSKITVSYWAILPFAIGALYGGIFGFVYGKLESYSTSAERLSHPTTATPD